MRAMTLVEIFLPLYDNEGRSFPEQMYSDVRRELMQRFGGLTAFTRAPAQGLWESEGKTARDDIVIFEVMAETLDAAWWFGYRRRLETTFRQDAIVMREQELTVL